jgi:hypothetical protein
VPAIDQADRESSIAAIRRGAGILSDVAGAATLVISEICTETLEAVKGITREAMMPMPHRKRAGFRRTWADRSSARAAKPIS